MFARTQQVDVAIAVVCRAGRILVCRRRLDARLGGCWEFPGGKVESGESVEQALARELREELAIEATPVATLAPIEHDYPDIRVRLHPILCEQCVGEPQPLACDEVRWVTPAELRDYAFPPANAQLLDKVIQWIGNPA